MTRNKLLTLSLLSIILLCISCSNEENIVEPQQMQKQAVNINITTIEQEFETDITKAKTTSSNSYYLWYTIHKKTDGSLVQQKTIDKSEVLKIDDLLEQGEYIYSVFAMENNPDNFILFGSNHYNYNDAFVLLNWYDDLFYKSFEVQVGETAVNAPAVLERIVSKITINIEDAALIPQNVTKIGVTGSWCPATFSLRKGLTDVVDFLSHVGVVFNEINREDLLKAQTDQIVFYMLPNTSEYYKGDKQQDISITLYETDSHIIIKRNFRVDRNVKVRLTGKLFPPKSSNSKVSTTNEWEVSTEQPFHEK